MAGPVAGRGKLRIRVGTFDLVRSRSVYLDLLDWRRTVAQLYADVRANPSPEIGHELWRTGRDELFRSHPQSPLEDGDPLRDSGLPYWPYDPGLRFTSALTPAKAC